MIELCNAGESRFRKRSESYKKRKKDHESARDRVDSYRAHHKVIKKITKKAAKIQVPYRMITVDRYKEIHSGRTPEADGIRTKVVTIKNKNVEVAMIRKLAEGEYDYLDEGEEGIAVEEELNTSAPVPCERGSSKRNFGSTRMHTIPLSPTQLLARSFSPRMRRP